MSESRFDSGSGSFRDHVAVPIWTGVSVSPAQVPADSKSMAVKTVWLITGAYLTLNLRPLFSLQARLSEL